MFPCRIVVTKNVFFRAKSQSCRSSLYFSVKIFKLTITEGNPWSFYVPTHLFDLLGHLLRLEDTFENSFFSDFLANYLH